MNNVSEKHDGAADKLIGNEQMEAAGETCQRAKNESGAIGWVLLWALGIPLPILLIVYLVLR